MSDTRVLYDRRTSVLPDVSFLVPVFNEEATLILLLQKLTSLPLSKEIIVVDDGSTDQTPALLSSWKGDGVVSISHGHNRGKGAAIQTALAYARGRFSAIQDGDLEYDPTDYSTLMEVAQSKGVRVVFGSRFLTKNPTLYRRFLWGNKVLTAWINFLSGATYSDAYACYKLIDTKDFRFLALNSSGFEMEAEICMKVALLKIPWAEVPISYKPRAIKEGKKIGWRDAVKGCWVALMLKIKQ